jgi:[mycofactocin precursor peptide]-tyrosine decarboxylase / 3-amino-5-[(4-hydroxyphenyl)methyl]-4,4-dimethylpyrrolidin-2-one synthase
VTSRPLPSASELQVAPFVPDLSEPLALVARAPASPLELVPAWKHAPTGGEAGPRYVFRREGFGALIYDRETCQYLPFDAEAASFLLARSESPLKTSSPDQASFLATMQREEILDGQGRLTARVVVDRSHPDQLSAPLTVYLGATEGCNLACSHCQADSAPGALRPVDRDLMERLFREQHGLGAMQVHVTGGEPLLHPDLLAGLDVAFDLGLNVLLTTNATLITERLAGALAERPFRCLSVSLDGPDAATHDAIRGEGTLAAALRGLRRVANLGPVGVTATLTPGLLGRIGDLARLCEENGAASLYLRPGLPAGRALRQRQTLPEVSDFERAAAELDRAQAAVSIPLFRPSLVPHQQDSARILEDFGCVAGNMVCSVSPDGQVNPCALLGPGFDTGSLAEEGLYALWSRGEAFLRLRELRGNPDCWSCKHYDYCGGGCRARALADGRDLNAPDPWCHYEPLEESEALS